MGELSESIEDDAGAGQSFSRAAEYFKEDGNSEASATKCLLKVADYAAMDKRYAKAVEIYEEVGASGLCALCQWEILRSLSDLCVRPFIPLKLSFNSQCNILSIFLSLYNSFPSLIHPARQ